MRQRPEYVSRLSFRLTNPMSLFVGATVALMNLAVTSCSSGSILGKFTKPGNGGGGGGGSTFSRPDLCYDDSGQGRRCIPDFINAAYGRDIQASNTCGDPPTKHCQASADPDGSTILSAKDCFVCDAKAAKDSHPSNYMTDLNNPNNLTCWISSPASRDENVTLTLSLGKKYEVTYASMQFCSVRPDSLAIFKSVDFGRSWIPFQFYSR